MKKDIESLLNNKEFCQKLFALESLEDISKEIKEQGFDIGKDDLNKIETFFTKIKENKLSDEELDKVAGGTAPDTGCLREVKRPHVGTITKTEDFFADKDNK